jgi:undecaprenyl phosphate N,N'-diacetylbacillosamine 1-phosphate transferase
LYKYLFKGLIDRFISLSLLFILFLPLCVIVLALFIAHGKKGVFFKQLRPGKDEKLFNIIKFKTMNDKRGKDGKLLPDAQRLTSLGRLVRKASLDELPQLINVLKGDMSLIGPRPLLPEYLSRYNETDRRRHLVKPGITGLSQVLGRNVMKFSERFKWDVYYVDNVSFFLDVKIILLTVKTILFKSSMIVNGQLVEEVDDLGLNK